MTIFKRFLLFISVLFGVGLFATPALAEDIPPPPVTLDASDLSTVALAAPIVTIIVGLLIPILNGLLTKLSTSSGVKALLTTFLAGASAVVTNGILADGSSVFTTQTLYTFLITWGISVLSYVGLYKNLGLTSSAMKSGAPGKLADVGSKDD